MVRWPPCRWNLVECFYGSRDEKTVKPVTGAKTLIVASRSEASAGTPSHRRWRWGTWSAHIPADDPFWDVVIGDPTVQHLFDNPVYIRGGMTLQVLRNQVGDRDFFRILRAWAKRKAGGNGTTAQFIGSPSASPAGSWTRCSTPGCSRPASRRSV
jgi:hypothetical protein